MSEERMNETMNQNVTPVFSGGGVPQYGQMPNEQQPEKASVAKKIGQFFLALSPIVACVALQLLVVIAVMVVIVIIALVEELAVNPNLMQDMDAYMAFVMDVYLENASAGVLAYHIVGTIVFGIWYYFSFKKPRPKVLSSFKKLNVKNLVITVLSGVLLCFFANGTVCIESVVLPKMVENYMEMAEIAGLGVNPLAIFSAIILAPIGEEFVCRGLAQKFAKKCFGKFWIANIFQALMFGLIHMNWVQGIYAFVIGLVLGWLVERYDSIVPAMILHCVVNFSTSTWVGYVLTPVPMNLVSGLILTIVPMLLIGALIFWAGKKPQVQAA
ncbi:MAG: CPBP family intramembrane metalloprotease [Lachnospiraceae bacterium]|nr:CPBP family intramembrane metalloprotease [Lachnospiraceae bacterium]